jgi:hypothetical protein
MFYHRFSRFEGHSRFAEMIRPRFFNLTVQPIFHKYTVANVYDGYFDQYSAKKNPGTISTPPKAPPCPLWKLRHSATENVRKEPPGRN